MSDRGDGRIGAALIEERPDSVSQTAVNVLQHLYQHGTSYGAQISRDTEMSAQVVGRRLTLLEDHDFVEFDSGKMLRDDQTRKYYRITDKGVQLLHNYERCTECGEVSPVDSHRHSFTSLVPDERADGVPDDG